MSYVRIWIHSVWGTKNREPILARESRQILFNHIRDNAKSKHIYVDTVNGYAEHVHCLFGLGADMTVSKVLQLIKGESSHWSNLDHLLKTKLEWADEYFAISVSESNVGRVREYIRNQEEHHRKTSFTEEWKEFLTRYEFAGSQG